MKVTDLLQKAVADHASDIFIIAGLPPSYRANGRILREHEEKLMPKETQICVEEIYELAGNRDISNLLKRGDDDFSFAIPGLPASVSVPTNNVVHSLRSSVSLPLICRTRRISVFRIPSWIFPNYPKVWFWSPGPAGSGKSTTLACLVNQINHTMEKHIITLEDPIEYLHRHDKSIVSQREINIDTLSYVNALRASLRQSPDVILLGEMRDYETIDVAMTAAETGHLVFSTLHTIGAANTIDRIIDVFPANQQRQIAVQLSMVLQAVVSQQLIPAADGTQVPAFEVMTVTPAIRNMIRDNKIPQIDGTVYSANKEDMHSMDYSLQQLAKSGKVTAESALSYASNPEMLKKKL